MFCIKCGKEAVVGNFCEPCFAEKATLFEARSFKLFYCQPCGIEIDEIKKRIEESIRSENKIKSIHVYTKIVGNKVNAKITCVGIVQGVKKEEMKKILVILRKKMCDMHVKLSGGYYEAMIQVRGDFKEEIIKKLKKLLPKKSVVDVESLNEGYNIKVMNKGTAASAARALNKQYTVKDSYKLVGSKKGQKLYRNFYSIR